MDSQLLAAGFGGLMGLLYGVVGFVTNRDQGEPFDYRKLARTTVIWAAAGVVAALSGSDPTNSAAVGAYTTTTSALGYITDQVWAMAVRSDVIDGEPTADDPGDYVTPDEIDTDDLDAAAAAADRALELIDDQDIKAADYNDFISELSDEFDYDTALAVWEEFRAQGVIGDQEGST